MPRSLVWATDIDVLPVDHTVARRDGDGYLVVRSPSNPTHYWGNFLLFDAPPGSGARRRWERCFAREFGDQPASRHRAFGWDRTGGELGAAEAEFAAAGYRLEHTTGMIAAAGDIHPHRRANRDVTVRPLDPHGDAPLWRQVIEIQVAGRDPARFAEAAHRTFVAARLADLRTLFDAGRGAWYVALLGEEVVGSCGVVVTEGRGRFQVVDTRESHRRRGICTRLIADAARHAAEHHGATQLVIAADPDYHAIGIYASVGFEPVERVVGVCLQPARDRPPG